MAGLGGLLVVVVGLLLFAGGVALIGYQVWSGRTAGPAEPPPSPRPAAAPAWWSRLTGLLGRISLPRPPRRPAPPAPAAPPAVRPALPLDAHAERLQQLRSDRDFAGPAAEPPAATFAPAGLAPDPEPGPPDAIFAPPGSATRPPAPQAAAPTGAAAPDPPISDEEADAAYGATAASAGPPMPWDPAPAPAAPAAPAAPPPPPPPAPWGDLVPDAERLDAAVPRFGARPPRDTTVWRTTVAGTSGPSRRGLAALLGGVITLAVAIGLIALLLRGNEVIAGAAPGSARLLIAAFGEGPRGAGSTLGQTTAQSIKLALDNARTPADQARLPVATVGLIGTAADAQSTLNRNQAQALLWGTLPDGVHGPISATLAWRDSPRADPWQRYGATGRLLVPPSVPLPDQPLTAAQALGPALRALQNYEAGDYDAARTQAESVPADAPAPTQNLAAFIRANSLIATEHAADAAPLYQALEARGWTGAALYNNWGVAALEQGDLGAARARLEQAAAQLPPGDQAAAVVVNTNRGLAALDGGDFATAQTAFDAALKADPRAAEAALQRGYLAYRRGDGATATRDTLTALAAAPDDPAVERQLGLIQLMVRNPTQALTHFQRALALYTSWVTALRAQEGASVSRADLRNATSATQRLVELNHELGTTQYYVGLAYADMARGEPRENFLQSAWRHLTGGQNDADRAIAAFQDAIRLDRDRADARYQMGLLYRDNGDRSQARDAFARAQQLAPTDPDAYEALASMDEEDQQPQQAVAEYQALIAANPGYTPAYVALAQLYERTGDTAGAEKTNSALVAQPARTPQEHFTHAEALAALNRPDEAAAEAQAALAGDPTMWQAHLFLAKWYAQSGRPPDALAEYNAVLAQQPGNVDALYESGRILAAQGQTDEAMTRWQQVERLDPQHPEVHFALGGLYEQKALLADPRGESAAARALNQQAIQEYEAAAAAHVHLPDAVYHLGRLYETQGTWSKSEQRYQQATQLNPDLVEAWQGLVRVLLKQPGRDADALKAAQAFQQHAPGDPRAYLLLGEVFLYRNDPSAARTQYEQVLKLAPGDPQALTGMGEAFHAEGNDTQAVQYYNAALQAAPGSAPALTGLGDLYRDEGQYGQAQDAYNQALVSDPNYAPAWTGLGRTLDRLQQGQEALKKLDRAIQLDPTDAEPEYYEGELYAERSVWDQAVQHYQRAAQLRPSWALPEFRLGQIFLDQKQLPEAVKAYQQAVKLEPNLVEGWFGLGQAQRDLGNRAEAINAYQQAIQRKSDYAAAWLYLGYTLAEDGQRDKAVNAFQNALTSATDDATIRAAAQDALSHNQ